jgi:hypothetical protein
MYFSELEYIVNVRRVYILINHIHTEKSCDRFLSNYEDF